MDANLLTVIATVLACAGTIGFGYLKNRQAQGKPFAIGEALVPVIIAIGINGVNYVTTGALLPVETLEVQTLMLVGYIFAGTQSVKIVAASNTTAAKAVSSVTSIGQKTETVNPGINAAGQFESTQPAPTLGAYPPQQVRLPGEVASIIIIKSTATSGPNQARTLSVDWDDGIHNVYDIPTDGKAFFMIEHSYVFPLDPEINKKYGTWTYKPRIVLHTAAGVVRVLSDKDRVAVSITVLKG